MKTVFLFPGQGVQKPEMGKDLYDNSQKAKDFFHNLSDIVHKDIPQLLFHTSPEELEKTENTQIAISAVSIATALVLQEHDIVPDAVAGFSLGEYAALALAEVVSYEDMFTMIIERGKIMEEVNKIQTQILSKKQPVQLGMTAILGLHPQIIQDILTESGIEHAYVSMYNSPSQGVISGTNIARTLISNILKEKGMRKAIPLKISGAFHTPLMNEAHVRFKEAINDILFQDPTIPIYSNVDGMEQDSGGALKILCLGQLVNPVYWIIEEENIWKNIAPTRVLEVGQGTVLAGLWKQWKASKQDESIVDALSIDSFEKIQSL